jgi:hypothetical protein
MKIDNLGSVGLNKDLQAWQLPPNAWTSLTNIRCKDGQIRTFDGYSDLTTPSVIGYFCQPIATETNFFWMYMGDEKVYAYNGLAHTDITRASGNYTGSATDQWSGCTIYGVPVITNGIDDPQQWTVPDTTTQLSVLTGWDTTWKCKVIRAFGDALFAFNISESGTVYSSKLRYSASGLGSLPTDWDDTSTTNDAGFKHLEDTAGAIVDALLLNDTLIIYKEDAVYGCQYIGSRENPYRFYRISKLPGALAQYCVVGYPGGHFVVSADDVYVHDGVSPTSVIDDRNRDFLFGEIDQDSYETVYTVLNQEKSEIWICYPESGEGFPNKALVWNYLDNTWYPRDLPTGTAFISPGPEITSEYSWDTLPYSGWDTWTDSSWGSRTYTPVSKTLVGVTTGTKMYLFDDGNQSDGVNTSCIAERTGLNIGDNSDLHTVTRIYPNVEGDSVNVYIGSQMFPNDSVTYEGPYAFNPSTDRKVDCRVTGVIHAVKFQSEADVSWGIDSYEFEYKYAGKR